MHNCGRTLLLKNGSYEACIVTVGAGLASLKHNNKDLVISHSEYEIPKAHLGKVLAPWPNRIDNAQYEFGGIKYDLPINDKVNNTAIHGLVAWKEWDIEDVSSSSCTLSTYTTPVYGYPFLLKILITYSLDEKLGLKVLISAQNLSDLSAPYGVGFHPYLTLNNEVIDTCKLSIMADSVFALDLHMKPTKLVSCDSLNLQFNDREILSTQIDHTFKAGTKGFSVCLRNKSMAVCMSSNAPYVQIYTGEKLSRLGLAAEPMTCPPNAFNSKIDLCVLKPFESLSMSFCIYQMQ